MKLPKNFGGGNALSSALAQAQKAMSQAQDLEKELEGERLNVDKNGLKAVFTGTGSLISLKIDKELVDPEDVETLEDLIVSVVRDGFAKSVELRDKKVQAIMPNVPGLDSILPG